MVSKISKQYFSLLELMLVTAVISAVFAVTALLIDTTRSSIVNMSIIDNLATNGMDVMNQIKKDMAQSALIFTPDENTGENHYVDLFDYGTNPQPYGAMRLPFEGDTMNTDDPAYNPNDAGNAIFFAKECAPYTLLIDASGTPQPNHGNGNTTGGNDPSHPPKKPAALKTGPDLELHQYTDEWYNSDGALVKGSYANYNIKRFKFMMYYIAEITGRHQFPRTAGGLHPGYLNLVLAETGFYADFQDIDSLSEPARSEVIAALMTPVTSGGAGITLFWDRNVIDPNVETAFYTFSRPDTSTPYTVVPLPGEAITFVSSKQLIQLSSTLSSGIYSIAYNDTIVNPRHTIPKYGSTPAVYPAGFEIIMSGNKQNRRIAARLITAIANDKGTIISEENQMLFQASEVSAASGIYYTIPTP